MNAPAGHTSRLPITVAVVVVLGIQLTLPEDVSKGPTWLLPLVQAVLLAPLVLANPITLQRTHPGLRTLSLLVAYLLLGSNLFRLVHLVWLIGSGVQFSASVLVTAALVILLTNVVGMAVLFWELDRGGPAARDPMHAVPEEDPDLLFPQMTLMDPVSKAWRPGFVDYLYTAFTATTALSPTDVMPLSQSFKVLFMLSAVTAATTVAVVAARAVSLI